MQAPNARRRAEFAIDIIRDRVAMRRLQLRIRADIVGIISSFDSEQGHLRAKNCAHADGDYRVRFAFSSMSEADARAAVQEVGALYCCGPAGGGGVRTAVRPRVRTLSRLVPRDLVSASFSFIGEAA